MTQVGFTLAVRKNGIQPYERAERTLAPRLGHRLPRHEIKGNHAMTSNIIIACLLVFAAIFGVQAAYAYVGVRRERSRRKIAAAAKQAALTLEDG